MRSTNPVFSRNESYATQSYGQTEQYQQPYQPYGQQQAPVQPSQRDVMTIDDVITKTAIVMGVMMLTAVATFVLMPPVLFPMAALVGAIVGFVTVMFVSMRRNVSPAGVLVYALIEGVFIGAFSGMFENAWNGIVPQAVLATFVAAGATLAAYKGLRIKVTDQFRKIVTVATFAFAGLVLVNLVLALLGIDMGIRGAGGGVNWLVILVSAVALVLAVANLIMDFDYVEQGVRNRLPASESWRAAFGITVTMVWLYTEILRVLSYFRSN